MSSTNDQAKIDFAAEAGQRQDRKAAEALHRLADDPSEDVRYYALRALVLDAVDRSAAAERLCWRLLETDASERVRSMAAACLGSLYAGSRDRTVFARMKERLGSSVSRFGAESILEALYSIAGRPPDEWPSVRRMLERQFGASPPDVAAQLEAAADLERRFL